MHCSLEGFLDLSLHLFVQSHQLQVSHLLQLLLLFYLFLLFRQQFMLGGQHFLLLVLLVDTFLELLFKLVKANFFSVFKTFLLFNL